MNAELLSKLPTESLTDLKSAITKELKLRNRAAKLKNSIADLKPINPLSGDGPKQKAKDVMLKNSGALLSLRDSHQPFKGRLRYYSSLINQDWSSVYPSNSDSGCFYVYAHIDPGTTYFSFTADYGGIFIGNPFYIGKGCGDRAHNLKRNQGHGKHIKKLLDDGWEQKDLVHIIFNGLSEQKAYELESKLIYFFGSIYQRGKKSGVLLNLDIPKTPEFSGVMKKFPKKYFEVNKEII